MRRPATTLLVAALLAGGTAACGDASSADEAGVVPALCDALAADDAAGMTAVFEDRVHRPLHDLADELQAADRTAATRLLEAKYGVETVVRGDADAPAALVHQRLEELDTQVRAALDALGRDAPAC